MKDDAQPNWESSITPEAQNSLSTNNDRLINGSDEVLISPLMEGISDEKIKAHVSELLKDQPITPTLKIIEDENLSKLGPRSIAIPWKERKASLTAYFRPKGTKPAVMPKPDTTGYLRPTTVESAAKQAIPSSNSGLPFMRKKKFVLNDAVADFVKYVGRYPCVLFTRTSEQKKTRNVWGYPIADTLAESCFVNAYLTVEKTQHWRVALKGPDETDLYVLNALRGKSQGDKVVCVDFEAFDASVSPLLIAKAFSHVAKYFQHTYQEALTLLCNRFQTIPIYTPDGEMKGVHGVPSGSSFTNTIDSLVQLIASGRTEDDPLFIQGDDGIYIVNESAEKELFKSFETHGLNLNKDKTKVFNSTEAIYLQRYYSLEHYKGGVYSIARALNRIKYLESFTDFEQYGIDGSDYFALRTIMILENCKHHPSFEGLVKLVKSWDKNGLAYTRKGAAAYSRLQASKARAGATFGEADLKGLDKFETVKLLNS